MFRAMIQRLAAGAVVAVLLAPASAQPPAGQQPPRPPASPANPTPELPAQEPKIERLGAGRYRIGAIELDRRAHAFELPGRVIRTAPPLEFLASRPNGLKDYETMLELDANALEFNVACLLLGLDPARATPPKFHFDPEPVSGDRVELLVSWEQDGVTRTEPAHRLLSVGGKAVEASDWAYTGSGFFSDGRYMAELDGTLIGFAHDPASIIEHADGLGLGDYGAVAAMPGVAPPDGTPIRLRVQRLDQSSKTPPATDAEKAANPQPSPPR